MFTVAKGIYRVPKKVMTDVLGILLKSNDFAARNITWHAAVARAKQAKNGWSEQRIYEYADDIVERTQIGATKLSRAPVQQFALGRFITNMQTFVIGNWNFIAKDILEMHGKSPEITTLSNKQMRRLAKFGSLVGSMALASWVMEEMVGTYSPFPTPMKELQKQWSEDDWNYFKLMSEFVEPLPILSNARYGTSLFGAGVELMESIMDKARGEYVYDDWWDIAMELGGMPGGSTISKIRKAEERGRDPLKAALRIKQ